MKCDICKEREAVINIQQIIGKERHDMHLCEICAMERGISSGEDKIELSISNLLAGLVDIRQAKENKKKLCPACGSSWNNIVKKDQMGCPECFTTYHKEVRALLESMNSRAQHSGRFPRRLQTYKTYLMDVVKLKDGLKEALKKEDYEKAAMLRDRIRDLEQSSQGERE